jgi:anti-sigma-K factor RskA
VSTGNVDIHHLAAAYALDAVDDAERHAFEAHFHSCEVCRADVADHRETLARLAGASPVAPSASVKDRVLAEIAHTRQLSPLLPEGVGDLAERRRRRRRTVGTTVLAAAAALMMFVAGAFLVDVRGTGFVDDVAAVLDDPDARFVSLTPDETVGATGSMRVVWSPTSGRAVLLGDDLPQAPDGEAYELWLIDADGPQPMRLLDRAADGEVRAVFDIAREPAAWGVTIEPATGSPAPTGDILFLAEA